MNRFSVFMNAVSWTALVLASGSGCSLRSPHQSNLSISFPANSSQSSGGDHAAFALPGIVDRDFLVGAPVPQVIGDFTCFGVNISSADIPTDPTLPACANMPPSGVIGGLTPVSGGTVNVRVPTGANRLVQLFAVKSYTGCPALDPSVFADLGSAQMSVPVELGRATVDVSGDASVNITATWDPASPQKMFCPSQTGVPTQIAIVGPASSTTVDCKAYSVEVQDGNGALVGISLALPVTLSEGATASSTASAATGFFTDAACSVPLTAPLSIASGASSGSIYFRGSSADVYSLSASAPGLDSGSLSVTVASVPAQLIFSVNPSSAGTAGVAWATQPQVEVTDAAGGLIASSVASVSLAAFTDSACTTAASGTLGAAGNPVSAVSGIASFTGVSFTHAQPIYLQASSAGLSPICSGPIAISPGSASSSHSTIAVAPAAAVAADGTSAATVTITLEDGFGNPIPGVVTTFSASGSSNTLSQPATATNSSGQATGTIASNVAQNEQLSISAPSGLSATASVAFSASAAVAANSTLTATTPVIADGSSTASITIVLKDGTGNPVPGVQPVISSSGSSNTIGPCSMSTAAGTSTCTLASTKAEVKTLAITSPFNKTSAGTVVFQPGPTATLALAGYPSSVSAGTTHTITVTALDANGNTATSYAGILHFTSTDSQAVLPTSATLVSGTGSFNLGLKTSGTQSITATDAVTTSITGFQGSIAVLPLSTVSFVAWNTLPPTVYTASNSSPMQSFSVMVQDSFHNLITTNNSSQITLSSGNGTLGGNTVLTVSSGVATFNNATEIAAGSSIALTATENTSGLSANSTILVSPGAPSQLLFSAPPPTQIVGGQYWPSGPSVKVVDSYGNLTNGSNLINLALFTDSACTAPAPGNFFVSNNPANASSGTVNFSTLNYLYTPIQVYLQASSGGLSPVCSQVINVVPPGVVAAGQMHTCYVSSLPNANQGKVFCWGDNAYGELGVSSPTLSTVPIQAGPGLPPIVAVAAGGKHTCAVSASGNVYCWGFNSTGQLGSGTTSPAMSFSPIEVVGTSGSGFLSGIVSVATGAGLSCALSSSGVVYCWGDNSYGQLGLGGTIAVPANSPTPAQALSGVRSISIAADGNHVCAIMTSGSLYCWGWNADGQLGNNATVSTATPTQVVSPSGTGALSPVAAIGAGYEHTCAIALSGQVYCWGYNGYGQLGTTEGTSYYPVPQPVQGVGGGGSLSDAFSLSLGDNHTCATSVAGQVECWGMNIDGQLGVDSTTGTNWPVIVQNVGGGNTLNGIFSVSAGSNHACALSSSGVNLFCWGSDSTGQLGDGLASGGTMLYPYEVTGY